MTNKTDSLTPNNSAQPDLAQVWPHTTGLAELYAQLSDLKLCFDNFEPASFEGISGKQDSLDIRYTYESNRIEGNILTLEETKAVIVDGITLGGKPLKEYQEAVNHHQAIAYIRDLANRQANFSQNILLAIHREILRGIMENDAGFFRRQAVYVLQADGRRHEFPDAYIVPKLIEDYFIFYEENKAAMHPVAMAAHLHQRLVNIHPFIDGNGRTARLVMNLHLLQHGYPIAILDSEMEQRLEYYRILSERQGVADGDSKPFERFIANKVKQSLFDYLYFLSVSTDVVTTDKGQYFFEKVEPHLTQ